jgi:hypothetical protein
MLLGMNDIVMDFLDGPDVELWNERKDWMEKIIDDRSNIGDYDVSD